jgi:CarD family transcriptional regulator
MKTGKLTEVATVVRNLLVRENEKGLSGAEKKMLNNARQIVVSEIVYAQNMEKDAAEKFMAEALFSK